MSEQIGQELKESELYPDQHEPWRPNFIIGDSEDEHIGADSAYYMMVNLFEYNFDQKAKELSRIIFAGLVGNGIMEFSMESVRFEEEKRKKGDNDAECD